MRLLLYSLWIYSLGISSLQAQDRQHLWFTTLTRAEPLPDYGEVPFLQHRDRRSYQRQRLKIDLSACQQESVFRRKLRQKDLSKRVRDYSIKTAEMYAHACGIDLYIHHRDVIGFVFTNRFENAINPQHRTPHTTRRTFSFRFEERIKQNMRLKVSDLVGVSGKISEDFMETTLVFIPRRVIPYLRPQCARCTRRQLAVILPTGEEVIFDRMTREIKGGVLSESPIDIHPRPRLRAFPRIRYQGHGVLIRADRRGGLPERMYSKAINRDESPRSALITHRGRTCRVPKSLIWANAFSEEGNHFFKYSTDRDLINKVLVPHCGWSLSSLDFSALE